MSAVHHGLAHAFPGYALLEREEPEWTITRRRAITDPISLVPDLSIDHSFDGEIPDETQQAEPDSWIPVRLRPDPTRDPKVDVEPRRWSHLLSRWIISVTVVYGAAVVYVLAAS